MRWERGDEGWERKYEREDSKKRKGNKVQRGDLTKREVGIIEGRKFEMGEERKNGKKMKGKTVTKGRKISLRGETGQDER